MIEGRSPDRAEDAVGDRALVRALDRAHVLANGLQALDRVLDADRQPEDQQPEAVAEVPRQRLVQRAQVERDERVQLVHRLAASAKVVADRARDRCHEHVVDRRVHPLPRALHGGQRHRLSPGNAMADGEVATQRAGSVGAWQQELHERAGIADRSSRHRPEPARAAHGGEALSRKCAAEAERRHRRRAVGGGRSIVREPGRIAIGVGEREHHARQRDAIRDRVMHPDQDRAPVAIALQQVDVPERPPVVQRRGDEVGDHLLQGASVGGCRQGDPVEVQVRFERRILLPGGRASGEALVDALAEPREAIDDALHHRGARCVPVEWLVEPQDGVDHHQVGAAVHVQPGRVGG